MAPGAFEAWHLVQRFPFLLSRDKEMATVPLPKSSVSDVGNREGPPSDFLTKGISK